MESPPVRAPHHIAARSGLAVHSHTKHKVAERYHRRNFACLDCTKPAIHGTYMLSCTVISQSAHAPSFPGGALEERERERQPGGYVRFLHRIARWTGTPQKSKQAKPVPIVWDSGFVLPFPCCRLFPDRGQACEVSTVNLLLVVCHSKRQTSPGSLMVYQTAQSR